MGRIIPSPPVVKNTERRPFWVSLKNGLITGASNNDPSGIVTFAQIGALTNLALGWLLLLLTPLVINLEEMSARVGMVAKTGVNKLIRQTYGIYFAIIVAGIILIANIVTLGANVSAMAEIVAWYIPLPWEILAILLVASFMWILFKGNYKLISRYLLIASGLLIFYVITLLYIDIDWSTITLSMPQISIALLAAAVVALVGNMIPPYLIFWQATEEIEEYKKIRDIPKESLGVIMGFVYSTVIALAIIFLASQIVENGELLENASQLALMLTPLAGKGAFHLFAIALLGSGFLGIPVLASSAAYAGAEALNLPAGWRVGRKKTKIFFSILTGTLLMGSATLFLGIPPIQLLFYTQVLNGFLVPILIVALLLIANNSAIMRNYKNNLLNNIAGIALLIITIIADIFLLINLF